MGQRHQLIDHQWQTGQAGEFASVDPATGAEVWRGRAASAGQVEEAIDAARRAQGRWADLPHDGRVAYLHAFADTVKKNADELAQTISRETGKPRWESLQETALVVNKVELSIRAYHQRRSPTTAGRDGGIAALRFKPHGVVAVFGPFNLPAHLPCGHIIPALLAGNTVVFKPSELSPMVGQRLMELWMDAGLPPGVMNLVQGGREVGATLAQHAGLDGVYFTGSAAAGRAITYACADHPHKILALEMGGNNPLVVASVGDRDAAAFLTAMSAYITAGQRCTCARRLILLRDNSAEGFLQRLVAMIARLRVGAWTDDPQPFLGPVITHAAARRLLDAQDDLKRRGGRPIVEMRPIGASPTLLSPGLIDVTEVTPRRDEELFGPLLQLVRVRDFDAAIEEANRTVFGLAAGLISDDPKLYQRFHARVRAGVINWNRQTTGASSELPFGGVGASGSHRPTGFWAADYCSYPVASLESDRLAMPDQLPPGISPSPRMDTNEHQRQK